MSTTNIQSARLTGKYDARQSWEKQCVYKLNNGATVTVEYSVHYGEMVSRIDLPSGEYWHCSNGIGGNATIQSVVPEAIALPEFAHSWIETLGHDYIVRPSFDR